MAKKLNKGSFTELEFSKISGFNSYYFPKDFNGNTSSDVIHVYSGSVFKAVPIYISNISMSPEKATWYSNIILDPMCGIYFEWPIDLVEVPLHSGEFATCMIFKHRQYSKLSSFRDILYQTGDSQVLDWRNVNIRLICLNLVDLMYELDRSKYAYHDFNMDRMYFNPSSGEVYLRFSPHVRKLSSNTEFDKINQDDLSIEFVPPYIYRREYSGFLKKYADYYQLSALLFRLMIGRLPYEGRDLMNYGTVMNPLIDTDKDAHKEYFIQYHSYPHFIFDEEDSSNELSPTWENELPKDRWKSLPEYIKDLFKTAFKQKNAENPSCAAMPSPKKWLTMLKKLEDEINIANRSD